MNGHPYRRGFFILIAFLMLGMAASCERSKDTGSSGDQFGAITATIIWPSTESGTTSASIRPQTAPVGVVKVRGTVTGPGMSPVSATYFAYEGGGAIPNVPVGFYRSLRVEGLDITDTPIYMSGATNLNVIQGETTNAGFLTMVDVTTDTTPPAAITGLGLAPGDGQVIMTWTNPADSDFAGVMIRRSTVSNPTGPTDGDEVYDGFTINYGDSGLANGTLYYYSIFTKDWIPNYSTAVSGNVTPNDPGTDLIPPTVSTTDPTGGSTNVALDKTVTVVFSEDMDQAATSGALGLYPEDGGTGNPDMGSPVSGAASWISATTWQFNPTADLSADSDYFIVVTTAAADLAGNNLAVGYEASFTTLSLECKWDVGQWDGCKWG
ncbi:MAG: hypothetical protein FVQ81_17895 [Candidatus Glassbacteria bacterium]|nr:hypothetical protein [Candidatus Glassbacteria bacterium]